MKNITKMLSAACLALQMAASVGASAVPFSFGESGAVIVASAATEDSFLNTKPTANNAVYEQGEYNVPVYMWTSDYQYRSMSDQSVVRTAKLKRTADKKYITVWFNPIEMDGMRGHIEKFYYYNLSANTYRENISNGNGAANVDNRLQLTDDSITYGYDNTSDITGDEGTFVKYISSVTFELPTDESDVVCRFKVDAMGDTEQDAIMVFDWDNAESVVAEHLDEKIAEAKKITNDNNEYTESSYSNLLKQISDAESKAKNSPYAMTNSIKLINYAISSLQKTSDVLEDGYYSIPISFLKTTATDVEVYDFINVLSEQIPSDEHLGYLENIFGDTAQIKVVDGVYTITLTAQNDGDDYYLCGLGKTNFGASKAAFTLNTESIDYFGKTKKVILEGCTATMTISTKYEAQNIVLKVNGWNKNEWSSKVTVIDSAAAFNLDWSNAVKTADLEIDKTKLEDYIGYVASRLNGDMSVYTEESVKAVRDAYDEAVKVNENSQIQAEINEALANLKAAMSGLKTYKTALQEKIDEVKAIDTAEYTEDSSKALADEIAKAEELLAKDEPAKHELTAETEAITAAVEGLKLRSADYTAVDTAITAVPEDTSAYTDESVKAVTDAVDAVVRDLDITKQDEVDEMAKAINDAVAALEKKPEEVPPKAELEDGKYTLNAEMYKLDRYEHSMSNNAINHTVQLEVKDGEYYITVQFTGLAIFNKFGYLKDLGYYDAGYSYNDYGIPQGKVIPAEVLSSYDVVDQYNDKDNLYPEMLRFKLVDKAGADFVPLQVFVPIMEAIAEGTGTQDVLMQLDWSTLTKTEQDIEPEKPVEQSPEIDFTDDATGVKIHADKGVFAEGTKVTVTAADVDTAENEKAVGFEVKFTDADGNAVKPNGVYTLSLPVPEDFTSPATYRINNGKRTLVNGTNENGFYTIKAKVEGTFALVQAVPEVPKAVKGDVNGDGNINVTDISKTAAHVKGLKKLTDEEKELADVNNDGIVNVTDISKIAAHVKGLKKL
jgi:hypothetical protein